MWGSSEPSRASKKEVMNVVSEFAQEALYMSAIMIGLVANLPRMKRRMVTSQHSRQSP